MFKEWNHQKVEDACMVSKALKNMFSLFFCVHLKEYFVSLSCHMSSMGAVGETAIPEIIQRERQKLIHSEDECSHLG